MSAATSKVVFLIDEQSLMTSLLSLQQLKLSIMRILIYFHLQKRQVQWGFRFFSTQTRYPSESMRRFYTFTLDSLEALEKEYSKRDTHRPKQMILGTPIMRIKQVLKEVIGDFQWENNDLGVPEAAQNHIFILSACPSSLIEMKQFFVSPHPDDSLLHVALLPQYFEQTKLDLSSTLLESYASRNIVLNIIDTHQQSNITRPHDQWIARVTREGFSDCLDQFKGRYIPLELLMRNACLFGRSFLSDIHSALTGSPSTLSPVWRGALKTLDVALDGMVLYSSMHDSALSDSSLMFVSEIRVLQLLHISQFSPGWLLNSDDGSLGSFVLTHDVPSTASDYRKCMSELFHTQSIMIAELVPIEGFEDLVQDQKVCIEAYSPEASFVRPIQIREIPIISDDVSLSITNYPLGPHCMAAELLPLTLPNETPTEEVSYKIKPLPEIIKQMIVLPDPSAIKTKKEKSSSSVQKERQSRTNSTKKRTPLPTDVNMLEKALEELYFESVYTQKHTIDTIIHTIKRWLNNLSRNHTIQEIIDTLFKYTSTLEGLETKYKSGVPKPTETQSHMTLEQTFQQEWWRQVKSKFQSDARSEKLISLSAKTREAQVQVVLYCFICRLMIKLPSSTVQRDPVSSAEDFFQKVVVTLTMHDLGRFLGELDSEEGPQAVKRRDPCDLSDHAFMTVLQRRFEQLPDLLQKFKELSGTDEMTSSGSSDLEDDVASLDFVNFEYPVDPIKSSPKSKVYRQQKRPMPDVLPGPHSSPTIKKMHSKTLLPTTSQLSSSKTLAPVKIKKTNSNTLDMFLKRTVDVKASVPTTVEALRGEAAQAAIAKVNRSALNGRPTMKRSGSFTSSAQAAKKQKKKTEPSMLSSQQETTGTVILRRSNNIPNTEETTPRTSMNRYLGTNLFADFSETCLSPSNRTDRTEQSIQIPKTPESTPLRFRKIMMDRAPHRRENSDNSLSGDFPEIPEDPTKTPYTPRTAARRERDRMDRSQPIPNLGRNLTMRLQDIFEQEKAKEDDFSVKSRQSSGIFFEDALNDSPMSSQADNNPFFTASSQASTATVSPHRPGIKRGATIDDLFDDDNDEVLGGGLMPLNFGQPYMIGEEDESDSDDEHAMPLI